MSDMYPQKNLFVLQDDCTRTVSYYYYQRRTIVLALYLACLKNIHSLVRCIVPCLFENIHPLVLALYSHRTLKIVILRLAFDSF